ncbi:ABC transporter ATP-binding protein, partial [bacterium]|nr:ABC transporter ATP-binding protein [bacterium]
MAKVQLHQISKSFDNTAVLDNISLTIEDGEFFFLLGPSGCGKTTLLRLIAGFNPPDHGRILLNNKDVTEVPPHKRHTAMVFQNYALWPHMTIRENLAFGLNLQHLSTTEKKDRVNKALQMVQMETYAERTPNQLSGGQQQRVALGRALVLEPAVVLLDEPLSNLDAKLRLDMRVHLQELHQRLNLTMIYVTHDQNEALSLADRMAVLQDGRIRQIGKP